MYGAITDFLRHLLSNLLFIFLMYLKKELIITCQMPEQPSLPLGDAAHMDSNWRTVGLPKRFPPNHRFRFLESQYIQERSKRAVNSSGQFSSPKAASYPRGLTLVQGPRKLEATIEFSPNPYPELRIIANR